MRESADQKNSEYGHFSRSEIQNQNFRPYLVSKSLHKVNKKKMLQQGVQTMPLLTGTRDHFIG